MSKRYKQKRRERYYRERIWDAAFTPSQGLDAADFEHGYDLDEDYQPEDFEAFPL